jgi:hypothetical protein
MLNLRSRAGVFRGLAAGLCLSAVVAPGSARAQPPGGPPPGGPGGPGRFGPPPGGPGFPGFGGRPSVSNVPIGALTAELKLSEKQAQDIKQLQDSFHKQQRAIMPGFPGGPGGPPPPGGPGGPPPGGPGGPGGPPPGGFGDPEQMRAAMQKMRALDEKTAKQIEAELTDSQKKALPDAMREIGALGQAGIPPDLLGDLNLSADQKSKILAISSQAQQDLRQKMEAIRQSGDFQAMREAMQTYRESSHKQVMAVLSADQRAMVDKFVKDHPMRGPGGFPGGPGGFGPPRGPGGPGGPPQGDPPPPPA